MELTLNEIEILGILRTLKPYEKVEVIKDQNGKVDHYVIHRSQKIVLLPDPDKQSILVQIKV